ncbi:MAG TPA: hypothetical protein VHD32_03080 [Candidatus Didemnitutus sp.]|nr:hypothetical protein [Candidatus Didemnitutus sp.]
MIALGALAASALASSAPSESVCPIPVEAGVSEFAPGDGIEILSVTGDRPHLESGGHYVVQGRFVLASADGAMVFLSVTTKKPSTSSPILPGQMVSVSRGSGPFTLSMTLAHDGWTHLSFYIGGREHGCIYFGERGVEATVLRTKAWSAFSRTGGPTTSSPDALVEYLGKAVPPPSNLDPRFTPEGILRAFHQVASQSGWTLTKVAVDDTEFPHLVYGTVGGQHSFEEFKAAVSNLAGYVYAGSSISAGRDSTCFALNLTPREQYPPERVETISRRLMVRLQMLMTRARQEFASRQNGDGNHQDLSQSTANAGGSRRPPGQ